MSKIPDSFENFSYIPEYKFGFEQAFFKQNSVKLKKSLNKSIVTFL